MSIDDKKCKKRRERRSQREIYRKTWQMLEWWGVEEFDKLTVGEIARRLGVNPASLSRAFNSRYYIPLRRVVELHKFKAFEIQVLCLGASTVKEALERLDIRCASHFIKRYKAHRSWSPGEYFTRNKARTEKEKQWEKEKN